jgi:hypothetical protein
MKGLLLGKLRSEMTQLCLGSRIQTGFRKMICFYCTQRDEKPTKAQGKKWASFPTERPRNVSLGKGMVCGELLHNNVCINSTILLIKVLRDFTVEN